MDTTQPLSSEEAQYRFLSTVGRLVSNHFPGPVHSQVKTEAQIDINNQGGKMKDVVVAGNIEKFESSQNLHVELKFEGTGRVDGFLRDMSNLSIDTPHTKADSTNEHDVRMSEP